MNTRARVYRTELPTMGMFFLFVAAIAIVTSFFIPIITENMNQLLSPCVNNGIYRDGKCICDNTGNIFGGQYCEVCQCENNGVCVRAANTPEGYACKCPRLLKWSGELCKDCNTKSFQNGTRTNTCDGPCATNFFGTKCDTFCSRDATALDSRCSRAETCNACHGNGDCNDNGECECDPGFFTGRDGLPCATTCKEDCGINGECRDVGGIVQCVCKDNFYGPKCDITCPGVGDTPCSGNGLCLYEFGQTRCECDPHHVGEACQYTCPGSLQDVTACNNHGTCVEQNQEAVCLCENNWYGSDCGCNPRLTCSGHGICNDDSTCSCFNLEKEQGGPVKWSGTNCAVCENHWYGSNCQLYCKSDKTYASNQDTNGLEIGCNDFGKCYWEIEASTLQETMECRCNAGHDPDLYCNQCLENLFPQTHVNDPKNDQGEPINHCTVQCSTELCNNHGVCRTDFNGSGPVCECDHPNLDPSTNCRECFPGWYPNDANADNKCSVYCSASDTDSFEIVKGNTENCTSKEGAFINTKSCHACYGNGICAPNGACSCTNGATGSYCQVDCGAGLGEVCSGHGQCVLGELEEWFNPQTQAYRCECEPFDPYTYETRIRYMQRGFTLPAPPAKEYFGDLCQKHCPIYNSEVCNDKGVCSSKTIVNSSTGGPIECTSDSDCSKGFCDRSSLPWDTMFREDYAQGFFNAPGPGFVACKSDQCFSTIETIDYEQFCVNMLNGLYPAEMHTDSCALNNDSCEDALIDFFLSKTDGKSYCDRTREHILPYTVQEKCFSGDSPAVSARNADCYGKSSFATCAVNPQCVYDTTLNYRETVQNHCAQYATEDSCDFDQRCQWDRIQQDDGTFSAGQCTTRSLCRALRCEDTLQERGIIDMCQTLSKPDLWDHTHMPDLEGECYNLTKMITEYRDSLSVTSDPLDIFYTCWNVRDRVNPFSMTTGLHGDIELSENAELYRSKILLTRPDLRPECIALRDIDFTEDSNFCADNIGYSFPSTTPSFDQGYAPNAFKYQLVCDKKVRGLFQSIPEARAAIPENTYETCEVKDESDTFAWSFYCVNDDQLGSSSQPEDRWNEFVRGKRCSIRVDTNTLWLNPLQITRDYIRNQHAKDCEAIHDRWMPITRAAPTLCDIGACAPGDACALCKDGECDGGQVYCVAPTAVDCEEENRCGAGGRCWQPIPQKLSRTYICDWIEPVPYVQQSASEAIVLEEEQTHTANTTIDIHGRTSTGDVVQGFNGIFGPPKIPTTTDTCFEDLQTINWFQVCNSATYNELSLGVPETASGWSVESLGIFPDTLSLRNARSDPIEAQLCDDPMDQVCEERTKTRGHLITLPHTHSGLRVGGYFRVNQTRIETAAIELLDEEGLPIVQTSVRLGRLAIDYTQTTEISLASDEWIRWSIQAVQTHTGSWAIRIEVQGQVIELEKESLSSHRIGYIELWNPEPNVEAHWQYLYTINVVDAPQGIESCVNEPVENVPEIWQAAWSRAKDSTFVLDSTSICVGLHEEEMTVPMLEGLSGQAPSRRSIQECANYYASRVPETGVDSCSDQVEKVDWYSFCKYEQEFAVNAQSIPNARSSGCASIIQEIDRFIPSVLSDTTDWFDQCIGRTAAYSSTCNTECMETIEDAATTEYCQGVSALVQPTNFPSACPSECMDILQNVDAVQFCATQQLYHTSDEHVVIPELEDSECSALCKTTLKNNLNASQWKEWCKVLSERKIPGSCKETTCDCSDSESEGFSGEYCELKCPVGASNGVDAACSGNGQCDAIDAGQIENDGSIGLQSDPLPKKGPLYVEGRCDCDIGSGAACSVPCFECNNNTYGTTLSSQAGMCDSYNGVCTPLAPYIRYNGIENSGTTTAFDNGRMVYPEKFIFQPREDILVDIEKSQSSNNILNPRVNELIAAHVIFQTFCWSFGNAIGEETYNGYKGFRVPKQWSPVVSLKLPQTSECLGRVDLERYDQTLCLESNTDFATDGTDLIPFVQRGNRLSRTGASFLVFQSSLVFAYGGEVDSLYFNDLQILNITSVRVQNKAILLGTWQTPVVRGTPPIGRDNARIRIQDGTSYLQVCGTSKQLNLVTTESYYEWEDTTLVSCEDAPNPTPLGDLTLMTSNPSITCDFGYSADTVTFNGITLMSQIQQNITVHADEMFLLDNSVSYFPQNFRETIKSSVVQTTLLTEIEKFHVMQRIEMMRGNYATVDFLSFASQNGLNVVTADFIGTETENAVFDKLVPNFQTYVPSTELTVFGRTEENKYMFFLSKTSDLNDPIVIENYLESIQWLITIEYWNATGLIASTLGQTLQFGGDTKDAILVFDQQDKDNRQGYFMSSGRLFHPLAEDFIKDTILFTGTHCGSSVSTECPGYSSETHLPCSGHGRCNKQCSCECDAAPRQLLTLIEEVGDSASTLLLDSTSSPYRGRGCDITCPGYDGYTVESICNNRGSCLSDGTCQCYVGYTGDACQFECPGFDASTMTNVGDTVICSDHGACETDFINDDTYSSGYPYTESSRLANLAKFNEIKENFDCREPVIQQNLIYNGIVPVSKLRSTSKTDQYASLISNDLVLSIETDATSCEDFQGYTTMTAQECEEFITNDLGQSVVMNVVSVDTLPRGCLYRPDMNFDVNQWDTITNAARRTWDNGWRYIYGRSDIFGQFVYNDVSTSPVSLRFPDSETYFDGFDPYYEPESLREYDRENLVQGSGLACKKPLETYAQGDDGECLQTTVQSDLATVYPKVQLSQSFDEGTKNVVFDCEIRYRLATARHELLCAVCSCHRNARDGYWDGHQCDECLRGYGRNPEGDDCMRRCPTYDGVNLEETACNGYGTCEFGVGVPAVCHCGGRKRDHTHKYYPQKEDGYTPQNAEGTVVDTLSGEYIEMRYLDFKTVRSSSTIPFIYGEYDVNTGTFPKIEFGMYFKFRDKWDQTCDECDTTHFGENCHYECGHCINRGTCNTVPEHHGEQSCTCPSTLLQADQNCCPLGFKRFAYTYSEGLVEKRYIVTPYVPLRLEEGMSEKDLCWPCPGLWGNGVREDGRLISTPAEAINFWWTRPGSAALRECNLAGRCNPQDDRAFEKKVFLGDPGVLCREMTTQGDCSTFAQQTGRSFSANPEGFLETPMNRYYDYTTISGSNTQIKEKLRFAVPRFLPGCFVMGDSVYYYGGYGEYDGFTEGISYIFTDDNVAYTARVQVHNGQEIPIQTPVCSNSPSFFLGYLNRFLLSSTTFNSYLTVTSGIEFSGMCDSYNVDFPYQNGMDPYLGGLCPKGWWCRPLYYASMDTPCMEEDFIDTNDQDCLAAASALKIVENVNVQSDTLQQCRPYPEVPFQYALCGSTGYSYPTSFRACVRSSMNQAGSSVTFKKPRGCFMEYKNGETTTETSQGISTWTGTHASLQRCQLEITPIIIDYAKTCDVNNVLQPYVHDYSDNKGCSSVTIGSTGADFNDNGIPTNGYAYQQICFAKPNNEFCLGNVVNGECVDRQWQYVNKYPCPAGKYGNQEGRSTESEACTSCPVGYFQDRRGSIECHACEPGSYQSSEGQSECIQCDAGKYQEDFSATLCESCTGKYYTSGKGSDSRTDCVDCDSLSAFTWSTSTNRCIGKCNSGRYFSGSQCEDCSAGQFQDLSGEETCKDCPSGRYQSQSGQSSCISCAAGKFSTSVGGSSSSVCQNCPSGKYSDISGITQSSECKNCPTGTYNTNVGSNSASACTDCGVGKYNSFTGQSSSSSCKTCPGGRYTLGTGGASLSSCNSCPSGRYSSGGSTPCQDCPDGWFQVYAEQSSCAQQQPCPNGRYVSLSGSITTERECTLCTAGKYQNEASQSSCKACPEGYYQTNVGQSSCPHCPDGKYSNNPSSTSCKNCQRGKYQDQMGKSSCKWCPNGRYQKETGQSSCWLRCENCLNANTYGCTSMKSIFGCLDACQGCQGL